LGHHRGGTQDVAVSDDPATVRTFTPVPPAERPRHTRRTVRLLVVDDQRRLLMFADSDPGVPGSSWWITPGGGVDPGETELEAAVRELEEEAGLLLDEGRFLGPILRRRVIHGYSDVVIDQEDTFYACWVPTFSVSSAGYTPEEQLTMTGHRWWTREELADTTETVWPVIVLDLWAEADARRTAVAAGAPVRPVLEEGTVEESTVPA
jgi:8-oxo-dGTP pyrophosphatase MutT (NUDIX family)